VFENLFVKSDYYGRILGGKFGRELKKRVNSCIDTFNRLDKLGAPFMPYLAAWQEDENTIWYEYTSIRISRLLGCNNTDVAEILRNNITTRRIYTYSGVGEKINQEVVSGPQLTDSRTKLRENSKKTGRLEAVYKVQIPSTQEFIWLKDEANIETYEQRKICISLGSLTIVTKEMQAEEEREELVQELQNALKNLKTLSGLLPICADCKKIRDDDGYWNQIESYISEHANVDFSHGICPDCAANFYNDLKKIA
jgi:hypothetical protein